MQQISDIATEKINKEKNLFSQKFSKGCHTNIVEFSIKHLQKILFQILNTKLFR